MITIEDNDLPITVAEKIIRGTKPSNQSPLIKNMVKALTSNDEAGETVDMFDIDEISEIAAYLTVYCNSHEEDY